MTTAFLLYVAILGTFGLLSMRASQIHFNQFKDQAGGYGLGGVVLGLLIAAFIRCIFFMGGY